MSKDREYKEITEKETPRGVSKESMAHHEKIMEELNRAGFVPNPQRKSSLFPEREKEPQYCPTPFYKI